MSEGEKQLIIRKRFINKHQANFGMSIRAIFDEIKPILDEYISQKHSAKTNHVGRNPASRGDFLKWVKENEITVIECNRKEMIWHILENLLEKKMQRNASMWQKISQ